MAVWRRRGLGEEVAAAAGHGRIGGGGASRGGKRLVTAVGGESKAGLLRFPVDTPTAFCATMGALFSDRDVEGGWVHGPYRVCRGTWYNLLLNLGLTLII